MEEVEEIGDRGDATAKRDVHRFYFVPIRKRPVSDDEGVGMANASEKVENIWVEDSLLEHGVEW